MTRLLSELDAFYPEHRRCEELDGAVACGAHLIRRIAPDSEETR